MATFLRCLYLPFSMGSIRKRKKLEGETHAFLLSSYLSHPPPHSPTAITAPSLPPSSSLFSLCVAGTACLCQLTGEGGGVRAKLYDSKKRVGLLQFIPSTNGLFLQKCASCCLLASSMSMVAMREVRKEGSVPNTSRQFALMKKNRRGLEDEVIFVPKTRRQFALIKENRRGLYMRSSLFETQGKSCPKKRESKRIYKRSSLFET